MAKLRLNPKDAALKLDQRWRSAKDGPAGKIDVVDMFSGCGGMSAGFLSVNAEAPVYRIAAAVDIDEIANRSYQMNLGVKPHHDDVGALARSGKRLAAFAKKVRANEGSSLVLIGCAPCQGFSSHRNAAGSGDSRNSLFVDFARIAAKLGPQAIVVENVPELLTDRHWPYVIRARKILRAAGYFVHIGVHNMAEFGVPQERFRVLILAMKRKFRPLVGAFSRSAFRTVRDAIGALPPIEAGERHPADSMHYSTGHKASTLETIKAVPPDGGNRPAHVGPDCLRRAKERHGKAIYEDVYGRLFWDRPAITITASARNPASGRYVHPEQNRGLSIREAALLQGFPAEYEFAGSLDEKFRQIGNAVPPAFAAHVAAHVVAELFANEEPEFFDEGIVQPVGPSFSRLIPSLKSGSRLN